MINMNEYNKSVFAKNLKKMMEKNNKTQTDIKNYLNVSKSTVSSWCNGIKTPRMDKIEMLSKYLGCTKSDLIEDTNETQEMLFNEVWKQLTPEQQEEVKRYAEYLLSKQENE